MYTDIDASCIQLPNKCIACKKNGVMHVYTCQYETAWWARSFKKSGGEGIQEQGGEQAEGNVDPRDARACRAPGVPQQVPPRRQAQGPCKHICQPGQPLLSTPKQDLTKANWRTKTKGDRVWIACLYLEYMFGIFDWIP